MKYTECENYKYKVAFVERVLVSLPDIDPNHIIKRYIRLKDGILSNYRGYCWDGSSVPFKKFVKFITFGFVDFDRYCKIASLHHDALCQLIQLGLLHKKYKRYIDWLYRNECILGGMGKKEADIRYRFLRRFGDKYIKSSKHPKGKILEVLNYG